VLAVIVLSSCRTTKTPTTGTTAESVCLIIEPITYSGADTAETKQQIKAHNAVYDELCP